MIKLIEKDLSKEVKLARNYQWLNSEYDVTDTGRRALLDFLFEKHIKDLYKKKVKEIEETHVDDDDDDYDDDE